MSAWQYIDILKDRKRSWLFSKGNVKERLNALDQILALGTPMMIPALFPYLKDGDKEIRIAVCDTIIYFFKKIETKKEFSATFRYTSVSISDIDLFEATFPKEKFVRLLAICSMNSDGYVRQHALKKLSGSNSPDAIPFIVYRLADWVNPVRISALEALRDLKQPRFINALVDNLPIFEWLHKVGRVNLAAVHHEIIDFILKDNEDHVLRNFASYREKPRLILARHLSGTEKISLSYVTLLARDQHFLIRGLSLHHFDQLPLPEIKSLLTDSSANVRLKVLRKLQNLPDFENLIIHYIADDAANIREFARYVLKDTGTGFSGIYHSNLLNEEQLAGSIFGIAEMDEKQLSPIVEKFLTHKKTRIIKAAFLALQKIDEKKAYLFALENLDNLHQGIRRMAIAFLSKNETDEVLEKARITFSNGDAELKRSMLYLFSKIGSMTVVPDIILATIDHSSTIRELGLKHLLAWKNQSVRLFRKTKPADLERARQVAGFAFETHEDKKYFTENPLQGIDFFLK